MKVYVVLEEDPSCLTSVAGVFASLEAAKEYLRGPCGSNCYLHSEYGEEVIGHKTKKTKKRDEFTFIL